MTRSWQVSAGFFLLYALTCFFPALALADHALLRGYEDGSREFLEVPINDDLVAYYHQRHIGEAMVEFDRIVYQFDRRNGALLARKSRWRDDLPASLPALTLTREQALARVTGTDRSARLVYIDPESVVFPLEPAPRNPCWVVRAWVAGRLEISILDAVTGEYLGQGVPPPYTGFSLTGPQYDNPCSGAWTSWSANAEYWFERMGYDTEHMEWPDEATLQGHIQSLETAVFYELAHGGSYGFSYGCPNGNTYVDLTPGMVMGWISPYTKMPFTFLGSCDGMCSYGPGTLSSAFRKGSDETTATVGYCGMSTDDCGVCWGQSLGWQSALFGYLDSGWTVRAAFDQANADYPSCSNYDCMVFAGDDDLALVPLLPRVDFEDPVFSDATNGGLGNSGDCRCVAWIDYDNDGDLDLHLVNHDQADVLLRNDGGDLFVDVATPPLADPGAGAGAAWVDFDNDGDLDLYLSRDSEANLLLRNDGDDLFTDITIAPLDDAGPGRGVAWADYDGDHLVDLYLTNHGAANVLFRSFGDPGIGQWLFMNTGAMTDDGNGVAAGWTDYDLDGDQDLFLANAYNHNVMYQNNGSYGFWTVLTGSPPADTGNAAGLAWGDCNNDCLLDLYVVNDGNPDLLCEGTGGDFMTLPHAALGDVGHGRAAAWGDYDNDGDLDLYLARHDHQDYLIQNDGDEQFTCLYGTIPSELANSNCLAWGDYDNDGDLDLYIGREDGNKLMRNDLANGNHWLQLELVGTTSNRSAVGATVRLVAGGALQFRQVSAGGGSPGQHAFTVAFGLGASTSVDSLVVTWPTGDQQLVTVAGVDQKLVVVEGNLSDVAAPTASAGRPLLHENRPNPFNPRTTIRYDLSVPAPVTLRVFDAAGRQVRLLQDNVQQQPGRHEVVWDGRDDTGQQLSSGIYLYVLTAGSYREAGKMALLK
ncbi:MAG: FG-GAP-like repeat-containing protein [bacterium]